MSLLSQYESAVGAQEIRDDESQKQVLQSLETIAANLAKKPFNWLPHRRNTPLLGLYLYGPVGGGKTFLMDLFYQSVTTTRKARYHFHHFMQYVDTQLRRLQGKKDPLRLIAANLAKAAKVLCLDEFMVYDIADAMILAELLQYLIERGVVLVATSNTPPDELYWNGLQRVRFLPAIALIKTHCQVVSLENQHDYRLGGIPVLQAYVYPLNDTSEAILAKQFEVLAKGEYQQTDLVVQNRPITYLKMSSRAIWFQFSVICNVPRSQLDYIELADRFDTIFISGIPILDPNNTVQATMFMHLVDVMYDKGTQLIISAAAPLDKLYIAGEIRVEFMRTLSRLAEMQTENYQHHMREGVA